MSPTWIEIDDEVLAKIKEGAEPFVDSPNDRLRKLLGLGRAEVGTCAPLPSMHRPRRSGRSGRAPTSELLPMAEYELPLLRALAQAGGSSPKSQVMEVVGSMLEERLTDLDRQNLHSGEVRWESRLSFARLRAVDRGHIRSDSRRGLWELTDAGIERLGQIEAERCLGAATAPDPQQDSGLGG